MNATANASTARASLKKDATALHLVEFWEQRADVELLQPRNKARPFRWQWTDIEPQLRVTATTVPIEECERRALVLPIRDSTERGSAASQGWPPRCSCRTRAPLRARLK